MVESNLLAGKRVQSLIKTLGIVWSNKAARFGISVMLFYIVLAVVGPVILPYNYRTNPAMALQPPKLWPPIYWFGTDNVGEPVLVDIANGAPFIIEISFLAGLYTTLIGLVVGLISGYFGGIVDSIIMLFNDALLTIPSLLITVIVAVMVHTTNPLILAGVLSITGWTGLARSVRSQVLASKEYPYIEVSKVLGLKWSYVLYKEILPTIVPYVWINLILNMEGSLYAAVGLYYLGLLPFDPTNWGYMISNALSLGAAYGSSAIWYFFFPTLFVVLFMVGLIELAYGIDEVINPRLRR